MIREIVTEQTTSLLPRRVKSLTPTSLPTDLSEKIYFLIDSALSISSYDPVHSLIVSLRNEDRRDEMYRPIPAKILIEAKQNLSAGIGRY